MSRWTLQEAIDFARRVEDTIEDLDCHVALTGSCLLNDQATHRNADIIIYRKRSDVLLDLDDVLDALEKIGVEQEERYGWCIQAVNADDKSVNLLFPDLQSRKVFHNGGAR